MLLSSTEESFLSDGNNRGDKIEMTFATGGYFLPINVSNIERHASLVSWLCEFFLCTAVLSVAFSQRQIRMPKTLGRKFSLGATPLTSKPLDFRLFNYTDLKNPLVSTTVHPGVQFIRVVPT